ncbi:N-acetyltransferase [Nocardioides mangrovicus]|uniref:N-acetyltransferase n=2 Tax=Nocardioides mangrovicus TaxID=2478913 RepID=A0A3L8P312_9ACTN|nr:N-acetyltransferase [Nocardioides mangrovicus]
MAEADADALGEVLEVGSPASRYAGRDPHRWVAWTRGLYAEHGFGLWVVETHDGTLVGDCGLTRQEVQGEWLTEIGWHVHPELRGRGYATEAATSVLTCARDAGIDHLVAIIAPDNHASQAVARRLGFTVDREVRWHGSPALVFGGTLVG